MSVRRNVLNVVRNYSDAEIKVREATSNDAWGPSSSLMSEIADMTYNVAAFAEIMTMIWKRVNDHGKNWRHVYKSLVLLDYLIKTGSERVSLQCKENIFAIQTLKDFQFIDRDAKDQGVNVREKSKQLVTLLKDEERLKTERARALKAKERFAQATTGIGSDHKARPHTAGEEELQLQLALSMSKEEAESERKKHESDQVRLELALTESAKSQQQAEPSKSLVDLSAAAKTLENPWGGDSVSTTAPPVVSDPFAANPPALNQTAWPAPQSDPWALTPLPTTVATQPDPWLASSVSLPAPAPSTNFDPFSSGAPQPSINHQQPTPTRNHQQPQSSVDLLTDQFDTLQPAAQPPPADAKKKSAQDFLGGAADLVNLDSLVGGPPAQKQAVNPFLSGGPFQQQPAPASMVSLNQMKGGADGAGMVPVTTIKVTPALQQAPMMMQQAPMPPAYAMFPDAAFQAQHQPMMMMSQQPQQPQQHAANVMFPMTTSQQPIMTQQWPTSQMQAPTPPQQQSNNPFLL